MVWLLVACGGGDEPVLRDTADAGPREVPWSRGAPPLDPGPRGWQARRAIVHLHSPWSHDACDGQGIDDQGVVNESCLQDFRRGLCEAGIDVAFVTDHPAHAAAQPYEQLLHPRDGDEDLGSGLRIPCDDGRSVLLLPGIEDELMPVGLDRHSSGDYDAEDISTVAAHRQAGGTVLVAHTESRDLEQLRAQHAAGMAGVEIFNLHASFAPDIRGEHLGLDPLGWATDIAPFIHPDATGEPDLFVLGVLEAQEVSVDKWDALLREFPSVGVGGTDAHQNVLAIDLRDGERGDSYRRMLRWFSNWVLTDAGGPEDAQAALQAGRSFLVFEILGTPAGLDLYLLDDQGSVHEMGSTTPAGSLVVGCPALHRRSPRGLDEPEIEVRVFKDGVEWARGCGDHATDGPGVYRVRVDITPRHLAPFLGEAPEPYFRPYPWVYSNALRVELP